MTQYFQQQFYEQIVVAANARPFTRMSTSVSYSFFDNGFSSIGLGMGLAFGPGNFYFICDNIPLFYTKNFMPYKLQSVNLRLGFNLLFGCTNKKKLKDRPFIYEDK